MTLHGQRVASSQLPSDIRCFLAPLDAAFVVRRFLSVIEPDIYVCMETELWPAIFVELDKSNIPALIVNGRLTSRSLHRYKKISGLMKKILGSLAGIGVISRRDADYFRELGIAENILEVTGNIK